MVIMSSDNSEDEDPGFGSIEDIVAELQPEDFLSSSSAVSKTSLSLLKSVYDFTKTSEKDASASDALTFLLPSSTAAAKKKGKKKGLAYSKTEIPLPNLIVEDFDEYQIWEELQLQNSLIYETLVSSVSKILAHQNRPKKELDVDSESDDLLKELENDVGDIPEDDDSDFFESDKKSKKIKGAPLRSYPKSIVDDKFFNLAQMAEHLDQVEAEIEQSQDPNRAEKDSVEEEESDEDNESVDYFKEGAEETEDEEEQGYYYKDFFDPPLQGNETDLKEKDEDADGESEDDNDNPDQTNSVRFNLEENEEEEDEKPEDIKIQEPASSDSEVDETKLSNFEKKRRKIEQNIKTMEDEAMQPKSWHLTGEVTAQTRPENSLLEEHLVYDHLIRQAPEITMKTTQKLEDIIKQRIKDQSWDDVIRKIKPVEDASEYKKRLVLDAEKSKMSLTDIYEKEYIDQQKKEDDDGEEEKEPEEHKQILKDMNELFSKLDALSNFHYTPKAPGVDIKVITNLPAISMEEVAPVTVSDATLLAPQEIQEPAKGEIKGKAERTATDKKRERRLKKKKQHLKRLSREEKARAKGLGLRNIKLAETVVKNSKKNQKGEDGSGYHNSKELKSSKAFFAKLQDQVSAHIDNVAKRKKKTPDSKTLSAKRFKL